MDSKVYVGILKMLFNFEKTDCCHLNIRNKLIRKLDSYYNDACQMGTVTFRANFVRFAGSVLWTSNHTALSGIWYVYVRFDFETRSVFNEKTKDNFWQKFIGGKGGVRRSPNARRLK